MMPNCEHARVYMLTPNPEAPADEDRDMLYGYCNRCSRFVLARELSEWTELVATAMETGLAR